MFNPFLLHNFFNNVESRHELNQQTIKTTGTP